MNFKGITQKDFDVFQIDGLDERMEALKNSIRPKLEELGQYFSPTLSAMTGEEMFYHVAKHARRTKNPPKDTWVAFANNKRGYKKHPHFQIGMWGTHVFVWFALIYEAPLKAKYSKQLKLHLNEIMDEIPGSFVWSEDHTKPVVIKHETLSKAELNNLIDRLEKIKKAELLCGINIDRNDPILNDKEKLLTSIEQTFETLLPLYRLTQSVD